MLQKFKKHFGNDLVSLQKQYETWWAALGANPTADRRDSITVETLANFLAVYGDDGLGSAEAFFQEVRDGRFRKKWNDDPTATLPPSLLDRALKRAVQHKHWTLLRDSSGKRVLILRRDDGM